MQANVLQLGAMRGNVLLFGGPYSNLAATEAMLEQAGRLAIAADQVICTGDVVAYGAEAEQTCQRIIDSGIHVVMGNCEQSLASASDDCGCGFEAGMACSALSAKWYRYARAQVSQDSLQWMAKLPAAIEFSIGGYRCRVIHGGVTQINRFIYASTEQQTKAAEIQRSGCDIVIGGHSGLPFGEQIGRGAWLNSGAIGLPANDGTPAVWYLLLEPTQQGLQCHWRRLDYDYQRSYASMRAAGLDDYADTIRSGLWPSMDALAQAERQLQGLPIEPFSLSLVPR